MWEAISFKLILKGVYIYPKISCDTEINTFHFMMEKRLFKLLDSRI